MCTVYCVYIKLYGRIYDKSTPMQKRDGKRDTVINSTVAFSPGREYACKTINTYNEQNKIIQKAVFRAWEACML